MEFFKPLISICGSGQECGKEKLFTTNAAPQYDKLSISDQYAQEFQGLGINNNGENNYDD